MTAETAPASSESDGRWRIAFVPTGNPLSVAVLAGAGTKLLTYSFTQDGFNRGLTQAEAVDKRLTLNQDLSRPGRKKESLDVKYVDSADATSADAILLEGVEGKIVIRRGVANDVEWAIGQKVDVLTIKAGAKRPDAPVENGVDTISQSIYYTAASANDQTLVA